jgi:itaconate CoA-transferase
MNTMAGVWAHPQLHARARLTTVGSPTGPLPAFWPPASQSGFSHHMGPVPEVGEHNEAILRELGMSL